MIDMLRRSLQCRALVWLLCLLSGTALADERILSYHGEIRIASDASMTVTETIAVRVHYTRFIQESCCGIGIVLDIGIGPFFPES